MPTASKKTTAKKKTGSTAKKTGRTAKRKPDKRTIAKKKQFFTEEISLILLGLLGLFLFLSNFGILGAAGNFFAGIEKGLFGTVGYILPVVMFIGTGLYVKYRDTFLAELKLVCTFLIIVILSALLQLMFGGKGTAGALSYYAAGKAGTLGGGLIGGVVAGALRGLAGTVGAYLIIVTLLIICMVFVTEASFINAARNGAEKTARAAKEGQELAREAAASYRERRLQRREEERILREERRLRGVNLNATTLTADPASDMQEGQDETALADEALRFADYGREIVGDQPGIADVDDGTGHGPIRINHGGQETVSRSYDSRYDTQVLPGPDLFSGIPDYDDDSVPFEETEEEVYKSYRFDEPQQDGASHHAYPYAEEARGMSLAEAGSRGYAAVSAGAGGASFGEIDGEEAAEEDAAAGASDGTTGYDGYEDHPYEDDAYPDESYDSEHHEEYPYTYPDEDVMDMASGRTVTATGQEIEATTDEAKALLKKKLAGEVDRIDTGDEQKPAADSAQGRAHVVKQAGPSEAENKACAQEIKKKVAIVKPYKFPPLNLLKKGSRMSAGGQQELRQTAAKLQNVLHSFSVNVRVTDVTMGPSVTRYELQPDIGVKVSRITSLADDIKLALAASDIRIEAPIPGKSAVGIEVPNKSKATVFLRDILETDEFKNNKSKLTFAVGRDIGGNAIIGDLGKMRHLLIAGATGSGKSVGINTLIMSLLYKTGPEDVRMIMIDPKVVELSVYNSIPHLLTPVVTDPKRAVSTLNWAVAEMMDRYNKFAEAGVKDLAGYNHKIREMREKLGPDADAEGVPTKMPSIVIIIDEFADLMMVAQHDVEDSVTRITQLARAAGIYLIVATQRPSVNVITGVIKANLPSRIAFQTTSAVDSRTILDSVGAERLIGMGDMLFHPSGINKPVRVQGCFVSEEEVEAVVNYLKANGEANYSEEVEGAITQQALELGNKSGGKAGGAAQAEETASAYDEYFAQSGYLIIEKEKASIGLLQRMFKIGFNRAARIMDQLAEAGVVGPEEKTKPRKVLMTKEEFEAFLSNENIGG
ncbi:MAG: DNA translocase FtsK 4TM domain-containing protein [Eubacteriales bacterium]|nr:DNA translocase FtsK 4TM domain-containing protein [Eubacteriales bacterium]